MLFFYKGNMVEDLTDENRLACDSSKTEFGTKGAQKRSPGEGPDTNPLEPARADRVLLIFIKNFASILCAYIRKLHILLRWIMYIKK